MSIEKFQKEVSKVKKVTNRKTTAKRTVAKKPAAAKKATARTKRTSSYYVVDSKGRKTNMKLTLTK